MKKVSYVKGSTKKNSTNLSEGISNIETSEDLLQMGAASGCGNTPALEKCRSVLQQDGEIFTDEELLLVYSFLKEMAELSVSEYLKTKP
ncbi:MAG: hypothetical protein WCO28_11575 [Bacteroidota bacterium]